MAKLSYKERLQRARKRRLQKRAGKKLIHDEEEMLNFIADKKVPVMVQHCVLKVFDKMKGSPKDKYLAAFNICSAVFQGNGYLKQRKMSMTGKGLKRNRMHQREQKAGSKKSKYKSLTKAIWEKNLKEIEETKKEDKEAK